VFDAHMAAEFQLHDADATMDTMTAEPFLTHVPVATGGVGRPDLHDFYRDHFVTKWPAGLSVERVSRTEGDNILLDEFIVRFTHDARPEPAAQRADRARQRVISRRMRAAGPKRVSIDPEGTKPACP
jgi:hypothetical protein